MTLKNMKVLMLGAGATGGYFGGRMLEAGRDVSFLVREHRAAQLRGNGLVVRSPQGDLRLKPRVLISGHIHETFDLVILACKAYDLEAAMTAIAPAVGPKTAVLPLLNGLRHFELLDERFGADRVLRGLCSIAVRLDSDGAIEHMSEMHALRFGEIDDRRTPRIEAIEALMEGCKFDGRASFSIQQAVWEKWVMLASLAGMTCLMHANVGQIVVAPEGRALMLDTIDECAAIAAAHGYAPRQHVLDGTRAILTEPGSRAKASMLRDLEQGGKVEADHILGDLIARGAKHGIAAPLLRAAHASLKIHEATLKKPVRQKA
ncbi:2-dehydropantoate 2-reductase [uncultured Nevskia sp.]|uniref:2-dehydropantoate 2-reductase n=1 Tax=uncultured Nevskia sp. TaxID=228950 RepID=UPI0026005CF1|nr:2-dehydropantoate 2-reductase [uncultured Nevskia sp.]